MQKALSFNDIIIIDKIKAVIRQKNEVKNAHSSDTDVQLGRYCFKP